MEAPSALSIRPHELLIKAGEVIYAQGDVSDGAYIIIEGRVKISRDEAGDVHAIATLDAGALLGEVGAIEESPRSVTATAITESKLFFINSLTFRRVFKDGDPFVRYLIETLANRLRDTYATSERGKSHDEAFFAARFTSRNSFMIGADSPMVEAALPDPIEIMSFPFTVSNYQQSQEEALISHTELKLPFPDSRSLSIPHFEIVHREGQLCVRDLGSKHGTIVNSQKISRYGREAVAPLHIGLNRIIAGSSDSFVRFLVQIPWVGEKVE